MFVRASSACRASGAMATELGWPVSLGGCVLNDEDGMHVNNLVLRHKCQCFPCYPKLSLQNQKT